MRFLRSNFSFLVAILFLASCSSMNVTEETVNANNVKTVKASQMMDENITYDSQAVFANATIYFDFDKTNLTSKSLQTLKSVAEALNENSQLRVTLAGHADERGTRDYNFALGERRAAAVAQFLRAQGVDGSRILTISYGKERPVALGSSEAIRARNRRAQMIIMIGGKN